MGPGEYSKELVYEFGKDNRPMTIGLKRNSKINRSPGPGDYDTDTSLNLTKPTIGGGVYIADKDDFEDRNSW